MKKLIKGGLVVDGTGKEGFLADVLVENDKIVKIGAIEAAADMEVIDAIVASIEKSGGVKVLDVDPGEATNRTVVTFVGSPEAVVEAAFQGVRKAGELIDMRQHHGAHPRSGATDVLPLIPISGVSLEECAELARRLAERIFLLLISIFSTMML